MTYKIKSKSLSYRVWVGLSRQYAKKRHITMTELRWKARISRPTYGILARLTIMKMVNPS